MRIAAIDIGTNSIHMIVVEIRPDLSFEVIDREKEMVRLGAGGLDGRALTPEAMHAALQVLSKFRRLAESHRVDEILAVATSATREAENGGEFLQAITQQTGIRPRVRGSHLYRIILSSFGKGQDYLRLTQAWIKCGHLWPFTDRNVAIGFVYGLRRNLDVHLHVAVEHLDLIARHINGDRVEIETRGSSVDDNGLSAHVF